MSEEESTVSHLVSAPESGDETVSTSDTSTPRPTATSYRFENFDGFAVITLLPELNKVAWADIDTIGTSLVGLMDGQKSPKFLIDLDALNYMGSAMVALVVRLWKSVKERNGKMAVVNSDDNVLEVLKLAGLSKVWTIIDSRDAGYEALGVSQKKRRSQGIEPGLNNDVEDVSGTGAIAAILAFLLLATAVAGLFLVLKPQDFMKDARMPVGLLLGGCILGLIAATATMVSGRGLKRGFGVVAILASLAILGTGFAKAPKLKAVFELDAPKPADTGHKNTTPAENEQTPKTTDPQESKKSTPGPETKTGTGRKTVPGEESIPPGKTVGPGEKKKNGPEDATKKPVLPSSVAPATKTPMPKNGLPKQPMPANVAPKSVPKNSETKKTTASGGPASTTVSPPAKPKK